METKKFYTDIPEAWVRALESLPMYWAFYGEESKPKPCFERADVTCLLHHIANGDLPNDGVAKKPKGVNYDSVLAAIKTLTSGGCTGSIHFYKDGEVRIEIT